jgi:hypothetical protein
MMHLGGKIEVATKHPLTTRDDLWLADTPGVARVCHAIHADPDGRFSTAERTNAKRPSGAPVDVTEGAAPEAALPASGSRRRGGRRGPRRRPGECRRRGRLRRGPYFSGCSAPFLTVAKKNGAMLGSPLLSE